MHQLLGYPLPIAIAKLAPIIPMGLFAFQAVRFLIGEVWQDKDERIGSSLFLFLLAVGYLMIGLAIWIK
jgi:hypothetical protein